MAQGSYAGPGNRDRRDAAPPPAPANPGWWITSIRFTAPLDPELFNGHAKAAAQEVSRDDPYRNKSSQLRRFYDELINWETRISQQPLDQQAEKFAEFLPFIRMLNAKAAYAEGRKLVDGTFVALLQHTLAEVTSAQSLTTCKHFWEAFMGFYKQERQD